MRSRFTDSILRIYKGKFQRLLRDFTSLNVIVCHLFPVFAKISSQKRNNFKKMLHPTRQGGFLTDKTNIGRKSER